MAATVQEISITYEEDGIEVVKELDKAILSKGSWSTIVFKYQQWDARKEEYGPVRFSIRRFRKMRDEYRQQAKFNISSIDQAKKIIATLQKWIDEVPATAVDVASEEGGE
jgi:cysteinyl-tRNA synthetase